MNILQHECYLECRLPRAQCGHSGKIRTVLGQRRVTSRASLSFSEAFALTLLREMPVNAAVPVLSASMLPVYGAFFSPVLTRRTKGPTSQCTRVGCDKISARMGHNSMSVFADLEAERVLYATKGKRAPTCDRFAEELPQHRARANQIKCVSIDMNPTYQKGGLTQLECSQTHHRKYQG